MVEGMKRCKFNGGFRRDLHVEGEEECGLERESCSPVDILCSARHLKKKPRSQTDRMWG